MYGEAANAIGETHRSMSPGERLVRDELLRMMIANEYSRPAVTLPNNLQVYGVKTVRYYGYQSEAFIKSTVDDTEQSKLAADAFVDLCKQYPGTKLVYWERIAAAPPYNSPDVVTIRWRAKIESYIEEGNK